MAKDPTYHTTSREYPEAMREVHHDHNNCPDGKRIKQEHAHQEPMETTLQGMCKAFLTCIAPPSFFARTGGPTYRNRSQYERQL